MMNLYEAIGCRHSVRKYTDREVTEKLAWADPVLF